MAIEPHSIPPVSEVLYRFCLSAHNRPERDLSFDSWRFFTNFVSGQECFQFGIVCSTNNKDRLEINNLDIDISVYMLEIINTIINTDVWLGYYTIHCIIYCIYTVYMVNLEVMRKMALLCSS